jgi:hypothetical protein
LIVDPLLTLTESTIASGRRASGPGRAYLDDEASLRDGDHERRVIETARPPSLQARHDRLVDPSVEPNRMSIGTERQPVEIDAALGVPGRCRPHDSGVRHRMLAGIGGKPQSSCGELRA